MINYILAGILALLVFLCISDALPGLTSTDSAAPRPDSARSRENSRREFVLSLPRRTDDDATRGAERHSARRTERLSSAGARRSAD
ncbi:MAG TPA: hypothetical protein VN661_05590 [Candidatus Acidoferrales bacterium]|nr:hypothetical protein [Candidatus Acidoferrales bacterium]